MQQATRTQLTIYLAPAVVFAVTFFFFPLLFIGYMTFHSWDGIGAVHFVGLQNISFLIHDATFDRAFINTVLWILVGLFIHLPFALLIALIIARRPFGWKIYRSILVLPNVISTTAVALLWYFVFQVDIGLLNYILGLLGLNSLQRPWLFDPNLALAVTQVPFVLYIGFTMMVFLSQISTISNDYYEAARIDGANAWQIDRYVTIPLAMRAVAVNALLITGYCLRMFEYPFIMTNGGPINASMNLSLDIYRSMVVAHTYGISMAIGSITVLLGLVVLSFVFVFMRRIDT